MQVTPDEAMTDNYAELKRVLHYAVLQASDGKGKERHACGEPFERQKICRIARSVGLGFPLGQALKKAEEAERLEPGAAMRELLGAINYLAAAYLVIEERSKDEEKTEPTADHEPGHGIYIRLRNLGLGVTRKSYDDHVASQKQAQDKWAEEAARELRECLGGRECPHSPSGRCPNGR